MKVRDNIEDRLRELVEEAGGTVHRDELLVAARGVGIAKTHALNVLKYGRRDLVMGSVYTHGSRGTAGAYVCTPEYVAGVVDGLLDGEGGRVDERALREALGDARVPSDLVGEGLVAMGYRVSVAMRGGVGEVRVWSREEDE